MHKGLLQRDELKINLFLICTVSFIIFFLVSSLNISYFTRDSNTLTGNTVVSGLVFFNLVSSEVCAIPLKSGWNLVSICANATNNSINSIFNATNGSIRFILEWNESGQKFLTYSPLQPEPPFTTLNLNKSYFVFFTNTTGNEEVEGTFFDDVNISMIQGYNSPTYPYGFEADIADYLTALGSKYSFALSWNQSGQEFLVYSPASLSPEYSVINTSEGQFILVTDAGGALLQYNKTKIRGY